MLEVNVHFPSEANMRAARAGLKPQLLYNQHRRLHRAAGPAKHEHRLAERLPPPPPPVLAEAVGSTDGEFRGGLSNAGDFVAPDHAGQRGFSGILVVPQDSAVIIAKQAEAFPWTCL